MIRIIAALTLALLGAGCVSEHQLPASTVQSFGFAGVSVQVLPKALVNDTEIENAAAAAAGIDPRDGAAALAFAGSPAGKDAVNQRVAALVAAASRKRCDRSWRDRVPSRST